MEGQLMPAERNLLHQQVLAAKPNIALEVGTWKGGGSTLQIVSALHANNKGILYTCEPDQHFYQSAFNGYKNTQYTDYIKLHNIPSNQLITQMINDNLIPDFIFFDGPEDTTTALQDFKMLDKVVKQNTVFMMHDWDIHRSVKSKAMRPYLENLKTWKITNYITAPESVGLVVANKIAL